MEIHFKLRELDKIMPWGQEPNLSLSWFGMTDGELWLTIGDNTIYEYTTEALDYFGDRSTPYNDYQLTRFIEDFTEIFDSIRESIPEELYTLTQNLNQFNIDSNKWLEAHENLEEDQYDDFYFEKYDKLISWIHSRTFDSAHLIGGPSLSFFRRNDRIRIVWQTEYTLENDIRLWTAKDGYYDMDYTEFATQIKSFGQSFFDQMDQQVNLAMKKDWGNVLVHKQKLHEELQQRKKDFYTALALLDDDVIAPTNWSEIITLLQEMKTYDKS